MNKVLLLLLLLFGGGGGWKLLPLKYPSPDKDLQEQFIILKKCRGKFECLIYEMFFIQEKKPELNTQSDSIKSKLF